MSKCRRNVKLTRPIVIAIAIVLLYSVQFCTVRSLYFPRILWSRPQMQNKIQFFRQYTHYQRLFLTWLMTGILKRWQNLKVLIILWSIDSKLCRYSNAVFFLLFSYLIWKLQVWLKINKRLDSVFIFLTYGCPNE